MRKGKQVSQNDEGLRKYFKIMFGFIKFSKIDVPTTEILQITDFVKMEPKA